MFYYI